MTKMGEILMLTNAFVIKQKRAIADSFNKCLTNLRIFEKHVILIKKLFVYNFTIVIFDPATVEVG